MQASRSGQHIFGILFVVVAVVVVVVVVVVRKSCQQHMCNETLRYTLSAAQAKTQRERLGFSNGWCKAGLGFLKWMAVW